RATGGAAQVPAPQPGGYPVKRRTRALAAAAVLVVAAAAGGVTVMSSAKQATASARQLPVGTAQVERRTLSAMISQAGILTYRAQSDGSPYSVINQARGIFTNLPAAGQVVSQ